RSFAGALLGQPQRGARACARSRRARGRAAPRATGLGRRADPRTHRERRALVSRQRSPRRVISSAAPDPPVGRGFMPSHALRSVLAVMILAAGCNPQGGGGGAKAEPKLDSDDSKAIYALGLLIAERIEQFGLSESELETFEAGVRDGVLKNPHKVEPQTLS